MARATESSVGDLRREPSLLQRAVLKAQKGLRLTQAEERELKRAERRQLEKYGPQFMRSFPKGMWLRETGANNKTMLEFSSRLSLPWHPHDKQFDAIGWVAELLKICLAHSRVLYRAVAAAAARESVEEFFPDDVDWQEECWKERSMELADKRLLRRRNMLDAAAVAEIHQRIADQLDKFGEVLGTRFGPEAQQLYLQTRDDVAADVLLLLSTGDGDGSDDETSPA